MYEEAKAASASQIDRFYLSYCGGNGTGGTVGVNERNIANYSGPSFTVGEPDNDSDQVLLLVTYLLKFFICYKLLRFRQLELFLCPSNFRNFHSGLGVRVNVVAVVVFSQRLRHQWVA